MPLSLCQWHRERWRKELLVFPTSPSRGTRRAVAPRVSLQVCHKRISKLNPSLFSACTFPISCHHLVLSPHYLLSTTPEFESPCPSLATDSGYLTRAHAKRNCSTTLQVCFSVCLPCLSLPQCRAQPGRGAHLVLPSLSSLSNPLRSLGNFYPNTHLRSIPFLLYYSIPPKPQSAWRTSIYPFKTLLT